MTCGLHSKLDAAYSAAREAFDEAHKTDALADNDLNLLFVYYQGIKKLKEALPEHEHGESINVQFPDGTYDPDYNITVPTGDDNISFDTNNLSFDPTTPITFGETGTVTVPDSEDDAKIVL